MIYGSVLITEVMELPNLGSLMNYGILGLFSLLMITLIFYFMKDYKKRHEATVTELKEVTLRLSTEKDAISVKLNAEKDAIVAKLTAEKDAVTSAFNQYLIQKNDIFLTLVSENTAIFKEISISLALNSEVVKRLMDNEGQKNDGINKVNSTFGGYANIQR